MEVAQPRPGGHGTTELMVEAVEHGVAQAPVQDPGAAPLVEEAQAPVQAGAPVLALEELWGDQGFQHPALEADLDLDFHHRLQRLNSSIGVCTVKFHFREYELLCRSRSPVSKTWLISSSLGAPESQADFSSQYDLC